MRYIKEFKMFESIEVESEIREILSDLTDDGDFNISIKREATLASMDSDDAIIVIIEKQHGSDILSASNIHFKWSDVSNKIQLLCDLLKDRYPIQIVEARIKLIFVDDDGNEKFMRTHFQHIDKFDGKLEFNLPSKEWIETQSRSLKLKTTTGDNLISSIHCEFVK